MRENKDKKITFWLIGFGCGIVLSGIMVMLYVLNSDQYKQGIMEPVENTATKEQKEEVETGTIALEKAEDINEEVVVEEPNNKEDIKTLVEEADLKEQPVKQVEGKITVYITKGMKALEIFNLLEQNGVVDDAQAFYRYVAKQNKTKYLRHGTIEFPINTDYDTVLGLLALK